jgi:hypothetical protein
VADFVAKVENRTTPKISQKLIFSRLHHCNTAKRPYEAPWSVLCGTMWSLISPRAKGISGPEEFWSSPQKDFFNRHSVTELAVRLSALLRHCQMALAMSVDGANPEVGSSQPILQRMILGNRCAQRCKYCTAYCLLLAR